MFKTSLVLVFTFFSLLITMNSSAQEKGLPYEKEWAAVQAFIDKSLPVSALEEVKKIHQLAKKDKEEAQVVKSLLYIGLLQNQTREENQSKSILELETELPQLSPTAQAVLQSVLAEQYYQLYQRNRWKFYSRTNVAEYNSEDILTWPVEKLEKTITDLYLSSLKNEKLLQETSVASFDALLYKGTHRELKPTLFDFLATRAIEFFESHESMINKPVNAFALDQASAFDPMNDFVHRKFPTSDTSSYLFNALGIYQRWISFRMKQENTQALIHADLKRLAFSRQRSTHPDKDTLYFMSVNHLADQYGKTADAAEAWFSLAALHYNKGQDYHPLNKTSNQFEIAKAYEISKSILTFPKFDTSHHSYVSVLSLIQQIQHPQLTTTVELVNLPQQPFRASVEFKNISNVHFRILKYTEELRILLDKNYQENNWPAIAQVPAVRNWQQNLPDAKDFQTHRTEIKIESLPAGKYILLASGSKNLNDSNNTAGWGVFHVSEISYFTQGNNYFVVNRDSGKPLAGVIAQPWYQEYDNQTGKSKYVAGKKFTTDKNGYFQYEDHLSTTIRRGSNYVRWQFTYKKDELFFDQSEYIWRQRNDENVNAENPKPAMHLFTDRGLYRPGQTIFVKGILVQEKIQNRNELVTQFKDKLILFNANNEKVDSVDITTTEYGSFSAIR